MPDNYQNYPRYSIDFQSQLTPNNIGRFSRQSAMFS